MIILLVVSHIILFLAVWMLVYILLNMEILDVILNQNHFL